MPLAAVGAWPAVACGTARSATSNRYISIMKAQKTKQPNVSDWLWPKSSYDYPITLTEDTLELLNAPHACLASLVWFNAQHARVSQLPIF